MTQQINQQSYRSQHQFHRFQHRLLLALGLLAGAVFLTAPVGATPARECPGFRVIRDRSDNEAPRLPRQSIAARAILSPDGCDRSRPTARERQSPPAELQQPHSPETRPDTAVPQAPDPERLR